MVLILQLSHCFFNYLIDFRPQIDVDFHMGVHESLIVAFVIVAHSPPPLPLHIRFVRELLVLGFTLVYLVESVPIKEST